MKVKEVQFHGGGLYGYEHLCPGCSSLEDHVGRHAIPMSGKDPWTFNGSMDSPTFSPSVQHTIEFTDGKPSFCCHYFIVDGNIQYCGDCTHSLSGTTVPLPEMAP